MLPAVLRPVALGLGVTLDWYFLLVHIYMACHARAGAGRSLQNKNSYLSHPQSMLAQKRWQARARQYLAQMP